MTRDEAVAKLKHAFHKTRLTEKVAVDAEALAVVLYGEAANDNNNRAARINDLVSYFHGKSAGNGWWPQHMRDNPLVVSNKLMLCVSELAEAMEGDRKGLMDDKLPHRKMIEVELGDTLIRICDLAGFLGLDLGGATMEKDAYNDVRADHKEETRKLAGGKAY